MHDVQPPMPRQRRRNAVLRLYDRPLHRDWAAWLTLAMLVITPFALGTGKKAADDPWPRWADVIFGTLTFLLLFGALPALIRLAVRRRAWHRRHPANEPAPNTSPSDPRWPGSAPLPVATDGGTTTRPIPVAPEPPLTAPTRPTQPYTPRAQPSNSSFASALPRPAVAQLVPSDFTRSQVLADARQGQAYPIAHTARTVQLAANPRDEYEAVLRAGEAIATCAGVSAAAALRDQVGTIPAFAELQAAFVGRGVAFGHWINVIAALNGVLRSTAEPIDGLTEAVRPGPKGTGLVADLSTLAQERNRWAHSGGPRTTSDATSRLETMVPALERALPRVEFLRLSPWVLVRSCALRRGRGDFSIVASDLMTDHPDFGRRDFVSSVPLAENTVYMLTGRGPVDLTPFVVVHDCPECHQTELCHADGLSREGVILKSFARGHSMWDRELASDVERLFVIV